MRVVRAEVHSEDPLVLALVLRATRVQRLLFGDHTVTAYAYQGPPWRWLMTDLEIPRGIVRQLDSCEYTHPPTLSPPPCKPGHGHTLVPDASAIEHSEPTPYIGYTLGTVLSVAGMWAVMVAGAGELAAASAAWAAGAVGYDVGRAVHHRLTRK